MTQEQNAKYSRLQNRIAELNELNGQIGRLSFYLSNNENELNDEIKNTINGQLAAMSSYRGRLEY